LKGISVNENFVRVVIAQSVAEQFLSRCVSEYEESVRKHQTPRQWAIVAGQISDVVCAEALHYASNIRDVDPFLVADYHDRRAPEFGGVYRDFRRGYQSDSRDLLNAIRVAAAEGREILGSIHMHADLQNIDRPDATSPFITELATPIDHDLFRNSGWPLNLILYIERRKSQFCWTLSAWVRGIDPESNYRRATVMTPRP
jgi:hypothetical protein